MARNPSIKQKDPQICPPVGDTKECIHCKEIKPLKEFTKRLNTYTGACKDCRKKKRVRRRHRPNYMFERIRKFPEKYLLKNAKTRARKKNLEFSLTLEDIIIPKICPIFNTPIILKRDSNQRGMSQKNYDGPSIDRIDTTKGYIKGNIIICSWRANLYKGCMTFEQIKSWYKFLKKHHEKKS